MTARRTADRSLLHLPALLLLVIWSAEHTHAAERRVEADNARDDAVLESLLAANRQLRATIHSLEHVYAKLHRPDVDGPIVREISVARQLTSTLSALLLPRVHAPRVLSADEVRGGALPILPSIGITRTPNGCMHGTAR